MKKKLVPAKCEKPRTWLITALLASIAIAYLVFVFLPSQRSIRELRSLVQERHQHILQAQSLTRPVALARERLAQTRQVGLLWQEAAPSRSELVTRFANLTQEAQVAGVTIERFDPQPVIDLQLVAQQNVTMHFQGRFAAVFEFVRAVEGLPGTVWVRDLRLSSKGDSNGLVHGELTLTIFIDRADYAD